MVAESRNAQILVVEDESIVALDIQQSLESLGYDVTAIAGSSESAFEKIKDRRPDLVLMDIMLKGKIDGVEAAEFLRREYDIPVIYLTALTDDRTLSRAKTTCPLGYLLKPFEEIELKTSIELAIDKIARDQKQKITEGRYQTAALKLNDGLWDYNIKTKDFYISESALVLLGFEPSTQFSFDEWFQLIHKDDRARMTAGLSALEKGRISTLQTEYRIYTAQHSYIWVSNKILAQRNSPSGELSFFGSINDVTIRRDAENLLLDYSLNDPLTNLPNRISFLDDTSKNLRRFALSQELAYSVLYLDIENFSEINISNGYHFGDSILNIVSERLKEQDEKQKWYRLQADCFATLVENQDMQTLTTELLTQLENPFKLFDRPISLKFTAGIAMGSLQYITAEELLLQAEKAMLIARAERLRFKIL